MNKPNREFVEDEYFSEVLGHPRLKFLQEGVYYDAHKQPVKGQPKGNPLTVEQKKAIKKGPGRPAKASKKETPSVTPMGTKAFNISQTFKDAEKENLRAAQAEKHIE